MSLVVAKNFNGKIQILSDSKVTDANGEFRKPLIGVLKVIVLSESL